MVAVLLVLAGALTFVAGFWLGGALVADLFAQADRDDRAEALR